MSKTLRIAIADDDLASREFLAHVLVRLGHELVFAAENGRQLADFCQHSPPDLVITDYRMPLLDGISAAAEINRDHAVPIIVLSGSDLDQEIGRLAQLDVVLQRCKPLSGLDLEQAIEEAQARCQEVAAAAT